jgi:hypothetical protein
MIRSYLGLHLWVFSNGPKSSYGDLVSLEGTAQEGLPELDRLRDMKARGTASQGAGENPRAGKRSTKAVAMSMWLPGLVP